MESAQGFQNFWQVLEFFESDFRRILESYTQPSLPWSEDWTFINVEQLLPE
jgi:hypothetical protein